MPSHSTWSALADRELPSSIYESYSQNHIVADNPADPHHQLWDTSIALTRYGKPNSGDRRPVASSRSSWRDHAHSGISYPLQGEFTDPKPPFTPLPTLLQSYRVGEQVGLTSPW